MRISQNNLISYLTINVALNIEDILGWVGAGLGITGAILLALNIQISGWGYVFFLASSVTLTVWSVLKKETHQLIMQVIFSVINIIGCIRWIF